MRIGHIARRLVLTGTVVAVAAFGASGCLLGKSEDNQGKNVSENGTGTDNGNNGNGNGNGSCVLPTVKLSPSNAVHAGRGESVRLVASLPVDRSIYVQSARVVLAKVGTTEGTATNAGNQIAYAQVGGFQSNGQQMNLSFATSTPGAYPVILIIQWNAGKACAQAKTIGSVTIS